MRRRSSKKNRKRKKKIIMMQTRDENDDKKTSANSEAIEWKVTVSLRILSLLIITGKTRSFVDMSSKSKMKLYSYVTFVVPYVLLWSVM